MVDLAFMSFVFHMLEKPVDLLENLKPSLKHGAPLVILEFKPDRIRTGPYPDNERVVELAADAGYRLVRTESIVDRADIYIFSLYDKGSTATAVTGAHKVGRQGALRPATYGIGRTIGPFTATGIVVAKVIGSGTFVTTGLIAEGLPGPAAVLFCWVLGGVTGLTGALSYGELATPMPQEGGEYVHVR